VKERASVVVKRKRQEERIPCLILDSSPDGFRIGGTSRLKREQVVEVILENHPLQGVPCSVIWVGKPGTRREGEVGLQKLNR
jgi:hypothetical protein